MPFARMKLQLGAFVLLSGGVVANVLLLQPHSLERLAGRSLSTSSGRQVAAIGRFVGDTGSIDLTGTLSSRAAATPATLPQGSVDITRAVQRELQARGYETGAADGVAGLVTRAAIMAFQSDHGLPLTGRPSQELLKFVLLGAQQGVPAPENATPEPRAAEAENVIKWVQSSLAELGYRPGRADGRMTPATARAIREFEVDQTLPETGRISGPLAARLARLSAQERTASGR